MFDNNQFYIQRKGYFYSVYISSYHLGFEHEKRPKRPVHLTAGPKLVILTRTFRRACCQLHVVVAKRHGSFCVVVHWVIP